MHAEQNIEQARAEAIRKGVAIDDKGEAALEQWYLMKDETTLYWQRE